MPEKEDEATVPYQFELPVELHRRGTKKAAENGLAIAPFMRMAYEQFVERPIEDSMALLRKHNNPQAEPQRERFTRATARAIIKGASRK